MCSARSNDPELTEEWTKCLDVAHFLFQFKAFNEL